MCTAITYKPKNFYFGRTLDAAESYPADVVISPRGYIFKRHKSAFSARYAIAGAAVVSARYPLYFDGMNERGLCMAGLNFIGNAKYFPACGDKLNLAQFELIPYILGNCATLGDAEYELGRINITAQPFSPDMPPAQLHWLVADRTGAVTVECTVNGINIFKNQIGVLTNNPPFSYHISNLSNYMHLTAMPPQNNLLPEVSLAPFGAGQGAVGLPGDMSSASRFVRAAFLCGNAPEGMEGEGALSQFFSLLAGVSVPKGACRTQSGDFYTQYACCCAADEGAYYFTTSSCRALCSVRFSEGAVAGGGISRYAMPRGEKIINLN